MKPTYKPYEFAKLIGVSVRTLQRWDVAGVLPANRTPTDRRFYTHKQYEDYMKRSDKTVATDELNN